MTRVGEPHDSLNLPERRLLSGLLVADCGRTAFPSDSFTAEKPGEVEQAAARVRFYSKEQDEWTAPSTRAHAV